jgi:NAD(P)-dependent dehydrogenase (short-subunit alcohol dehydrogenase family)
LSRPFSHSFRLEVFVNVVGVIGPAEDSPDLDIAAWDAVMRLNLTSMVMMTKYAVSLRPQTPDQYDRAFAR